MQMLIVVMKIKMMYLTMSNYSIIIIPNVFLLLTLELTLVVMIIFCREAPKKELKRRKKMGITFTAGLSIGQVVGVNSFKLIVNEIACEVGLDNPDRQTSASL
jgi:hypothetical protein